MACCVGVHDYAYTYTCWHWQRLGRAVHMWATRLNNDDANKCNNNKEHAYTASRLILRSVKWVFVRAEGFTLLDSGEKYHHPLGLWPRSGEYVFYSGHRAPTAGVFAPNNTRRPRDTMYTCTADSVTLPRTWRTFKTGGDTISPRSTHLTCHGVFVHHAIVATRVRGKKCAISWYIFWKTAVEPLAIYGLRDTFFKRTGRIYGMSSEINITYVCIYTTRLSRNCRQWLKKTHSVRS